MSEYIRETETGRKYKTEDVPELLSKIQTLEAQLEVLTKCECDNKATEYNGLFNAMICKGCKNKKLLEGVKGE